MSNPNAFPSYTTTSTTVMGTTTTKVEPLIWFDSTYIHTRPGQLKVAAVALDLIGFICSTMGSCTTCGSVTFYNLIAILGFWTSLSLLGLYLFHVIEKLNRVNWLLSEFIFTGIWCVFFLVSSLILLTNGGVYAAASFFGFLAGAVYGYDAFLKYHAYQAGELAQSPSTASGPTFANNRSIP